MPNNLQPDISTDAPSALSFRDFRDEEIVGFFANGHQTFHPMAAPENGFGWQRLVGAVHSPSVRRPTAAFRAAVAVKQGTAELCPLQKSVLRKFQSPTLPLPLPLTGLSVEAPSSVSPFDKQTRSLGTVALAGRKIASNGGRAARVLADPLAALSAKSKGPKAPCPNLPGIPIDGSIKNLGEKTLENADGELTKVVERWPRLSPAVKEIIGTLVERVEG